MTERKDADLARLRKLWRAYYERYDAWEVEHARLMQRWHESDGTLRIDFLPRLNGPPFPDELRGMTCGARTRAGTPCKIMSLVPWRLLKTIPFGHCHGPVRYIDLDVPRT